jgi:TolB-like protein
MTGKTTRSHEFYEQLKNRRVIRTAVVYLAFFWGAVEVADLLAGAAIMREGLVRWLIAGGALAFPVVLTMSWFFEAPWRKRRWFSVLGDVSAIMAISVAILLLFRGQLFTGLTRPVVAMLPIEPTDTRQDTIDLAAHLSKRFRMLLATSPEIRVVETASSLSDRLATLPIADKSSLLHADYLLAGTVNQGNGLVRLNFQVFNAEADLVWSGNFSDRFIDQAQLQNRVLNEIWPSLPLSAQALEDVRGLIVNCEYPTDPAAIRLIANLDSANPKYSLEPLNTLIEDRQDSGLLHLARAKAYIEMLEAAEPGDRPVLYNMAMQDLDHAEQQCPGYPGIELLRLSQTRQLQDLQDEQPQIFIRHPSNARLLLQTARDHANRGEYSTAVKLGEEAWLLNPLDAATTCEYLHLLKVTKGSLDTKHSKDVENVLSAVSLNGEELCRDLSTAQ